MYRIAESPYGFLPIAIAIKSGFRQEHVIILLIAILRLIQSVSKMEHTTKIYMVFIYREYKYHIQLSIVRLIRSGMPI